MAPSDSQKPLTENNGQEEQKYQNILDEYAKQVKPEPPVEDSTPISSEAPPHLPLQSSESPPVDPTAVGPVPPTTIPEHPPVKDPAVDSLSLSSPPPSASPSSPDPGSQLPPTPPSVPPSVAVAASAAPRRSSGFFKVLFLLSLVVFLLVYGAIAYNFFFKKAPLPTPSVNPTQVPTDNLPVDGCLLNGQVYAVNQTFPAADGCNTCTCTADLAIECTEIACDSATGQSVVKSFASQDIDFSFNYPSSLNLTVCNPGSKLPDAVINLHHLASIKCATGVAGQEIHQIKFLSDKDARHFLDEEEIKSQYQNYKISQIKVGADQLDATQIEYLAPSKDASSMASYPYTSIFIPLKKQLQSSDINYAYLKISYYPQSISVSDINQILSSIKF